jgi:hypothetical protein
MPNSQRPPFFYALQPKELTADRFYKIFVTERAICGAWVAGQYYDEQSAQGQLMATGGLLGLLLSPFIKRWIRQRHEREQRYEAIDPDGPDFLTADRRNFRLARLDIAGVVIKPKAKISMHHWAAGNRLEINMADGTKMRFILVGDQEAEQVRALLARIVPSVEIT